MTTTTVTLVVRTTQGTEQTWTVRLGETIVLASVPVQAVEIRAITTRESA